MHRKDRPGSRWSNTPRNTPCHPDTHPEEREQALRHKRRHRLPGDPSETLSTVDRLKGLYSTLEKNGDSHQAWSDLAGVFADLSDRRRSTLCEHIAKNLRSLPPAA